MLKNDKVIQNYVSMSKKTISKLYKELVKQPENSQLEQEIFNLTKFVDEFEVKHA